MTRPHPQKRGLGVGVRSRRGPSASFAHAEADDLPYRLWHGLPAHRRTARAVWSILNEQYRVDVSRPTIERRQRLWRARLRAEEAHSAYIADLARDFATSAGEVPTRAQASLADGVSTLTEAIRAHIETFPLKDITDLERVMLLALMIERERRGV